ncbi:universal stress protein [Gloeobacter kilaueensis]|uniref:Universal stress protein UspG n=1 Tax=Gloeobacter kilaueensis (strain ATCC BAA-2537 / CCAP 1431/1 / ULC 316 / JS1) TaxID=1183438 RepID=U5QNW7_GLOK1|nr:universal stress protein [Gloeobacter kilaueensis]AGY60692.1 universal stress protein UspG [Gloeobacter kilaueensis JS1]
MKFLVAIDGSPASEHALARAIDIARPSGASLLLLTVAEVDSGAFWPGVLPTGEPVYQGPPLVELEEVARAVGEAALEKARKLCEQAELACETRLEFGHARETICEVAEKEKPDVLVIGSRGLGGMQRLMLGSVSDYVLHHAHCPVLVVR